MDNPENTVIGEISPELLSAALTAIHRGGHGHHARVLDAARGDLAGQLRRAGVESDVHVAADNKQPVLLMLHAPGRVAQAVELLSRAGAHDIQVVFRTGATAPAPAPHRELPRRRRRYDRGDSPSLS